MADPDHVDESLAIARRALAASAASKARVRARVDASRAVAHEVSEQPVARNEVSRIADAPRAARGFQRLKTSLAAGALVGVGFIAGYWLARHPELDPLAAASPSRAPVESLAEGAAPAESADGSASTAASASTAVSASTAALAARHVSSSSPRARPPSARKVAAVAASDAGRRSPELTEPPEAPRDAFLDELALLSRVERAIRGNQAELALTLLGELERRHPGSSLGEERAAARLLANCLLHEPTARAHAERFVRERASSVYVERVRLACNLPKGPASSDTDLREGGRHVQTP